MDENWRKTLIIENYQNPFHKGLIDSKDYIMVNNNSETCIDEINLMVKVENNKIIDAYFDGEACAICTSSCSLMIDMVIGKTVEEAKIIYNNFINMINEEKYDENILENLIVYDDIYKKPNRKMCAMLPWITLEKAIKKNNEDKNL